MIAAVWLECLHLLPIMVDMRPTPDLVPNITAMVVLELVAVNVALFVGAAAWATAAKRWKP